MPYDLEPRYPVLGGAIEYGHEPLVRAAAAAPRVIAIDGPAAAPWSRFVADLVSTFGRSEVGVRTVDARDHCVAWPTIQERTDAAVLRGDPVFARIHDGPLSSLFE